MQTSGENVLSTRKIVVMIAVICIVGFLIVDGPVHDKRSVRSFIGQKNGEHTRGTDQVSTDILNGYRVAAGEFTAVVGIKASTYEDSSRTKITSFTCTGVLLSKRDVLTAGHCCNNAWTFRVHTGGRLNQKVWSVTDRNVRVMRGYTYDESTYADGRSIFTPEKDLCMMQLDKSVDFDPEKIYVSHTKPGVGKKVEIVGYGMIRRARGNDGYLYSAKTNVTSCSDALNWARNKQNVVGDIVCAGHTGSWNPWRYTHNACSGDSGGPMLSLKLPNGGRNLYGILSDGNKPCEAGLNSYTDVAKREFRNFIRTHSGHVTWMPICNSPLLE